MFRLTRASRVLSLAGMVLLALPIRARAQTPIPAYHGPQVEMTRLADGVYAFVWDNPLGPAVDGNSLVIINDADVVVVDAQYTPVSAAKVVAAIKRLTDKPVRYVITTHWHGDHWQGNQVYQDAWPGVEFVAHQQTLRDIRGQGMQFFTTIKDTLPSMLAQAEGQWTRAVRRDGKPYTGADSAFMRNQIALIRWLIPAVKEMRPVLPTVTLTDSLVLHRGERDIVIRYLGRGNTQGDLSVWLPKERVLATGDLLVNPAPYSIGSYLGEWLEVLTKLRSLPATVVLPGHGAIQHDWAYLDLFVELLQTTRAQTRDAVARGLDLEATRRAVDLSALRSRFTGGNPDIGRAFDAYFVGPAVERAWLEARGELDKPGA